MACQQNAISTAFRWRANYSPLSRQTFLDPRMAFRQILREISIAMTMQPYNGTLELYTPLQISTSKTPFQWRFAGRPIIARSLERLMAVQHMYIKRNFNCNDCMQSYNGTLGLHTSPNISWNRPASKIAGGPIIARSPEKRFWIHAWHFSKCKCSLKFQ